jgi:hypothetical protein
VEAAPLPTPRGCSERVTVLGDRGERGRRGPARSLGLPLASVFGVFHPRWFRSRHHTGCWRERSRRRTIVSDS